MEKSYFTLALLQEAQELQLHTRLCTFRIFYYPKDGDFRVRLTTPSDEDYEFPFYSLADDRDSRADMDSLRRIWKLYEGEQVTNSK